MSLRYYPLMEDAYPNTLKERLNEIALNSDMHVSQVVRMACAELVFRRSQTGTKDGQQPIACG